MRSPWLKFPGESGKAILRLLGLIVITGALSSCSVAYYKPSYPDNTAKLTREFCGRNIKLSSPAVLKLPIPDGHIDVVLSGNRQNQLKLDMCIVTSEDSTLQFTSNVIRRTDLDIGKVWTVEAKYLYLDKPHSSLIGAKIPFTEVIDFGNVLPTMPKNILNDQTVWIPFSIEDFSPNVVQVNMPSIIAGSKEYQIPPLLWNADKEGKTVEVYEKSWGWWPYTEAKVKVDRFTVDAGVTGGIKGSSKIDPRLKSPTLEGNIMINFPVDAKWRFSKNQIQFEDVNSGNTRKYYFTHIQDVSSPIKVAFTTPFSHTREARLSGKLEWQDGLPIGEERVKTLRIEIPPLMINGKEFIIKTITVYIERT